MRARKKPWAEGEIAQNHHVIKNAAEKKGSWRQAFPAEALHVEIGCGKGSFLTGMAERNPQILHIGIEREKYVLAPAARKIGEKQNIKLILGDVSELVEFFAPREIGRLYINFCDPWPRKKWAKRRLTHRNFLTVYRELLEVQGAIFFKTDNKDLFTFSLNEFSDMDFKLKNITLDLHQSDMEDNIMTEYETKFHEMGDPIYRCEAYLRP